MKQFNLITRSALVALLFALGTGCSSASKKTEVVETAPVQEEILPSSTETTPADLGAASAGRSR